MSGDIRPVAVLPIKDMVDAKQRLSAALSPEERRGLFAAMAEDVLAALAGAPVLAGVLVVTRDPAAAALAARHGAEVWREPANRGQTPAVMDAIRLLASRGVAATISIPADVPLITADEVAAVVAAHRPAPSVTIAPAHDRLGSNAMLCSPPTILELRFGDASFEPHVAQARALGIEPTLVPLPGLGLDVDHPRDLAAFAARPSPTRAYAYLREQGILARLAAWA
ncbi:MAG: 2-phospho-L-lactate guanylyltransferase [Ectothiorhodospiraceae bacterium]|nr:2-phospho-L-lactate guanylyltransferase [Chromatiales bacterium]MCP5153302.1 2-phospho-L-lactate guanylyltransferase [Ectothiorhodospiraceae bacterium]